MKRAIDLGAVEAAAIRTPSGKIRLRLLLSAEQLEQMLIAARDGDADAYDEEDVTQCDASSGTVTHGDARGEKRRSEHDDEDDARARPPPTRSAATTDPPKPKVFVIRGTRAWDAWMDHRKRTAGKTSCPMTTHVVDGTRRDGWWFETLFPPGPEPLPAATPDDEEFARSA